MNLYELNQSGYLSLPKMTNAEVENKKHDMWKLFHDNYGKYYMLLCNELRYYTLFNNTTLGRVVPLIDTVVEVTRTLGTLKAIEINESMIEFWVEKDGECHMYVFFNYDKGVIEV